MTFIREGKRISYEELIETMDSLVKQNILSQLEMQELSRLLIQILDFTEETIAGELKEAGHRSKDLKKIFLTAKQHKLLNQVDVWNKAIEIKENEEAKNQIDREEMIHFISNDYLKAMKSLNKKLRVKRING